MNNFVHIKTEYANGKYNGIDYGSKIRIVMRSEHAVLYVGYGLNYHIRDKQKQPSVHIADNSKKETFLLPAIRENIISLFGIGSDIEAIKAISTRGNGTVLVSGGGETLPLPSIIQKELANISYTNITPTTEQCLAGLSVKTCLQCNGPLPIHTAIHHLGNYKEDGNHPTTLEECQRLSNQPVVKIIGYSITKPKKWWKYVDYFLTWDEESYRTVNFCHDNCAILYAHRAAELQLLSPDNTIPITKPINSTDIYHHYKEEERYINGFKI